MDGLPKLPSVTYISHVAYTPLWSILTIKRKSTMSTFRHVCYRPHYLNLSDEGKLYLERVFAQNRFIENYFTTLYQQSEAKNIDPEVFKLPSLWRTMLEISSKETYQAYANIDTVFVESALINISDIWTKVLTKGKERPEFRKLTDDQVVWVFDTDRISLFRDYFVIPGLEERFELNSPKIKLFGEPVCYYLHRDKLGNYFVVFLYERTMAFPYLNNDPTITALASQLHVTLYRSNPEVPYDSDRLAKAAILRKRILIKLLSGRNTPELNASVSRDAA